MLLLFLHLASALPYQGFSACCVVWSVHEQGRARKSVPAQKLWFAVMEAQVETGNPYMLFKDSCNRKSNQQNLGTIKSSNLCTEILEYTSPEETAVCNLASIALPRFVRENVSFPEITAGLGPGISSCGRLCAPMAGHFVPSHAEY